jgi:6-pyruvoyltetrahydropterin/6-carboxytetrahydropterin synthase
MHGHNYKVVVTLFGQVLAESGMVLDFGDVDVKVKPIIDAMDHRMLVSNANKNEGCEYSAIAMRNGDAYELPLPHSTAEYIASYIHEMASRALHWTKDDLQVRVEETPRNAASYP